jgi:hypothetical protein
VDEVDLRRELEQLAGEMRDRAASAGAIVELARL